MATLGRDAPRIFATKPTHGHSMLIENPPHETWLICVGIAFVIDLTDRRKKASRGNLGAPYHFNQSIAQCRRRRSSAGDTDRHNQSDSATNPSKRVVTSNSPIATA